MAVWSQLNDLNCRKCNEQLRKIRGCDNEINPVLINGIKITRCPLSYSSFLTDTYIQAYAEYRNGYLPNAGGWLDQPMKFKKMKDIIANLLQEAEEKQNAPR